MNSMHVAVITVSSENKLLLIFTSCILKGIEGKYMYPKLFCCPFYFVVQNFMDIYSNFKIQNKIPISSKPVI